MEQAEIYVHIPFCRRKCRYCSFVSTDRLSRISAYVDALIREMQSRRSAVRAKSVYIGGGTPSCMFGGAIERIARAVQTFFRPLDGAEFTVEANPESASDEFFDECRAAGVNRISMGLQCACDEVLKKAGRIHTVRDFTDAVARARRAGFDNISADFMIGLENETHADLVRTLDLLTALSVPHVSVYSLSVEKGCAMYGDAYRPDEDFMADEYAFASDYLRKKGYDRYEISNFALAGKEGRHNLGYWLHTPYLGFGAAAHSYYGAVRSANTDDIEAYIAGTAPVLTEKIGFEQYKEEYVMLRMRLKNGIDLAEYEKLFGEKLTLVKQERISRLIEAGFIEIAGGRLFATDKGVYLLNGIITELI